MNGSRLQSAGGVEIAYKPSQVVSVELDHIFPNFNQVLYIPGTVLQELLVQGPLLEISSAVGLPELLFHRLLEDIDAVGCFVAI